MRADLPGEAVAIQLLQDEVLWRHFDPRARLQAAPGCPGAQALGGRATIGDEEQPVQLAEIAVVQQGRGNLAAGHPLRHLAAAQLGVGSDRKPVAGDDLGSRVGGGKVCIVAQAGDVVDVGGYHQPDPILRLAGLGDDDMRDLLRRPGCRRETENGWRRLHAGRRCATGSDRLRNSVM